MLKMMAMDEEDLAILAAHCQDAVFKASDLHYSANDRRLIITMNRFAWEAPGRRAGLFGRKSHERRQAALHVDRVNNVATKNIRPDHDDVLSILTLSFEADGSGVAGTLLITLAAGGAVRVKIDALELRLSDLGGAWETKNRPRHPA